MILVSARATSDVTVRDRPRAPTVTAIHCHTAKRVQPQVQRPRTSSTNIPNVLIAPPLILIAPPRAPTVQPRILTTSQFEQEIQK